LIVGAVVLAAGKSERMGRNKLLLPLNGKTLIENVLDALAAAGVDEQVVVLGHQLEEVAEVLAPRIGKIKIALNVDYERGMASSLQTGLIVLPMVDAAFMVLGDQPILEPQLLRRMIEKLDNSQDALLVSPVYEGKKGHPLLVRRALFGQILALSSAQTLHDVVEAHADALITIEAPQWSTLDIDTPEDYERLKAMVKNSR
jgi:molybdenum cofactor cytidylyltransferase